MSPDPRRLAPLALVFSLSGAAGLVHEVVWSRALGQALGQSLQSLTAVLVAFLGGLALGAAVGGRLAGRLSDPLRAYARLEFGIALYGVLSPALIFLLPRLFESLAGAVPPGTPLAGLRLALSILVLAPPTLAMGATFPILVRQAAGRARASEHAVATLYGANTVGAALGALGGAFVLLPLFGTRLTFVAAAALNLAAGVAALRLRSGRAASPAAGAKTPGGAGPDTAGPGAVQTPKPAFRPAVRVALMVATASGAVGALLQVGWIRMLTLSFGSSVYAVGLGLSAYILGLGLGPLVWSRWPLMQRLSVPGRAATAQWLVGCLSLLLLPCFGLLPSAAAQLSGRLGGSPLLMVAAQFLFAALLLLPPTMAQGAAFPPLTTLASPTDMPASRAAGRTYAASTWGSVAGFLIAGFIALPLLGTHRTLTLASALALLLCGVLWLTGRRGPHRRLEPTARARRPLRAAAILVLAPAPLLLLALPSWDPHQLSGGGALYGRVYRTVAASGGFAEATRRRGEILYYREEGEALVTVRRSRAGILSLQINGRTEASSGGDMATQLLVTHLPLLAHGAAHDVLLVGLASGVSLGAAERHPVRRVRTIEIVPGIIEAARLFGGENDGALDDPRAEVILDDARSHLLARAERYDVIASQPSNPWVAGVANLFTTDFYRLVRRRLRPGGLFCQWVQAYQLDPDDLRGIVRSFLEVFPDATLWEESAGGGDYFLLGGDGPLRIDPGRLQAAPAEVWDDLRRAGLDGPADLLARFVSGPRGLAAYSSGAVPHTDDNLYLEWRAPLALFRKTLSPGSSALNRHRDPVSSILPPDLAVREPDLVAALRESLRRRESRLAVAATLGEADLAALSDPYLAAGVEYLRGGRFFAAAGALSQAAAHTPDSGTVHLLLGEAYRATGLHEAAALAFSEAVRRDPDLAEAWNALGRHLLARGSTERARQAFEQAVRSNPRLASARNNLGTALLREDKLAGAEEAFRQALADDPRLAAAHTNLGLALKRRGDPAGAEQQYRAALILDPLGTDARYNLAVILRQTGRAEQARETLRELLRFDPGDREAQQALRDLGEPVEGPPSTAAPARRTGS